MEGGSVILLILHDDGVVKGNGASGRGAQFHGVFSIREDGVGDGVCPACIHDVVLESYIASISQ